MNYFLPLSLENFKLNSSTSFIMFFFNRHIAVIVAAVFRGIIASLRIGWLESLPISPPLDQLV